MTNDDLRRSIAEIATHLAEVQALARKIRLEHPDGDTLYRALSCGCLPAEHADPVGIAEDLLLHPPRHVNFKEEEYERFR